MSDQDSGATAPSASQQLVVVRVAGEAPVHIQDPRNSAGAATGSHVRVERVVLFDLLDQLKKLSPCHKDPHRFHERKDEIVARLYYMATAS
jgi:hypothetical protein